ncbi:MAG: UvrD-helicase domain-containing protein [Terracidiphilus sp.]
MPDARQTPPPDQAQRLRALDASRSLLVRAPAGSGKTNLLTRRFLRLLGEVDDPGEIVAITFTKAAAAEMRQRILGELEKAAGAAAPPATDDSFSMESLAQHALARSRALGWDLLNLPAQLRISTIDSFCRELALQQPILSGLAGTLEIHEQPKELYRRAARRTLEQIEKNNAELCAGIEMLLLWRDNSWQDLESQLVTMLARRDQWMHGFILDSDPDWDALREQLERPFAREIRVLLAGLDLLFAQTPGAVEEAHNLARFACAQSGGALYRDLAELADFPAAPYATADELDEARRAYLCLAELLLTKSGRFRQRVDKGCGFPAEAKKEKARVAALIATLKNEPAFEDALAALGGLPPARYPEEDWGIVRACFALLRHAAAELRVVFAENAAADFVEVAQIALRALRDEDGLPNDAAQAAADGIRHLLVDEFQDTSRRQHQLLAHLVAAWSGRDGRTCFVVGDPMQSIYFFRDADAELFPRTERLGLEVPGDLPLRFDPVLLTANFRTAPALVDQLNRTFAQIFTGEDGIAFVKAEPARDSLPDSGKHMVSAESPRLQLHCAFMPGSRSLSPSEKQAIEAQRDSALLKQTEEIVACIRGHLERVDEARARGEKYRVAVIGRARKSLTPVAQALRNARIPFRAVELEELQNQPEIIDALALARALHNPEDRVAWLGVLRAPWCGLSLADLHTLASADDEAVKSRPIPDLLSERTHLLSESGQSAVARLLNAVTFAKRLRSSQPAAALGTWLEQVWLHLGGAQCVDAVARTNLDLLWSTLDALPHGEPDLIGPALGTALDDLKALPDPAADSDYGVQLMTIHGAKGLEFEVVIVPDMQAIAVNNKPEMLSWLERGLPPDAEAEYPDEVTEFLVAPLQPKGNDRGAMKKWVDKVRSERERLESRRLLYVAATRAREELHLFARPEFKAEEDGSLSILEPRESLLKTAWPALRGEVQQQLEEWQAETSSPATDSHIVQSLAASAGNVFAMPAPQNAPVLKPIRLRRLPSNFQPPPIAFSSAIDEPNTGAGQLYERHEGGLVSRALGKAVHELFQRLAQLLTIDTIDTARTSLAQLNPRIEANLRAAGIDAAQSRRIATQALAIVLNAASDPNAQWILAPHAGAASEARWTGVVAGSLRTVQVDRVFRAGLTPQSTDSSSTWWIVDYKTAHEEGLNPADALPSLHRIFAPQIDAYAKVLRNLHGAGAALRGGLYYPRMRALDWWEL